jgi:hypothetical protein
MITPAALNNLSVAVPTAMVTEPAAMQIGGDVRALAFLADHVW